jgi:hypothetical protein
MECLLEADPAPEVKWHHSGTQILPSTRVTITLDKQSGSLYKASLIIKVSFWGIFGWSLKFGHAVNTNLGNVESVLNLDA